MSAEGLCRSTALGGRRWSAHLDLSYRVQPGCPLYQDHIEELVLSSLVLFVSVSSLSLYSVQHATWEHSAGLVADSGLMGGCLLS